MRKIGDSEKDTVAIANGHDIIFDNVSLSWARDDTVDLNQESGAELYNITLQDSIVTQGLQTHSTGGLINTTGHRLFVRSISTTIHATPKHAAHCNLLTTSFITG